MGLRRAPVLLTGEKGPLAESLAEHLKRMGARLVEAPEADGEPVRFLFHIWSPAQTAPLGEPPASWYDEAVAQPVRTAARLAQGLQHLCLVRTEDASVPVRVLEEALGFLARQRKLPFAVLRAPESGAPGRLPAVAAFVATAGLAGRICVGRNGHS